MTEFGCLGLLCFLLLSTFRLPLWLKAAGAWGFTYLNAVIDEFHQSFIAGRGPQFSDTLIDLSGALITVSVFLGISFLVKRGKRRKSRKRASVEEK